MNIAIVTGANGFVGKAVVKELTSQGIKVFAVVRKNAKKLEDLLNNSNVSIIECNMNSYSELPKQIENADVFYHFAWNGSAGPLRADEKIQLENIQYSCDAIRAAAKIGCHKFVMAGSIMEYEVEAIMRTAQSPVQTTIYCTAKKTADYMCRAIANTLGIGYICGLISNIYGPGEVSPRLINTSIKKILKKEHMAFSAGEQIYDFIYITDAAKIFVAIGEKGSNNKIYYIGSRNPYKLKDFLVEMRDAVDKNVEIGIGELPFCGVSLSYKEFDIDAVYRDTGVEVTVPFSEGIKNTANWIRKEEE